MHVMQDLVALAITAIAAAWSEPVPPYNVENASVLPALLNLETKAS